jgi:hypothetical protein
VVAHVIVARYTTFPNSIHGRAKYVRTITTRRLDGVVATHFPVVEVQTKAPIADRANHLIPAYEHSVWAVLMLLSTTNANETRSCMMAAWHPQWQQSRR